MPFYKILIGKLVTNDMEGNQVTYAAGENDTFETDKDLDKYNAPGLQPKFMRLDPERLPKRFKNAARQGDTATPISIPNKPQSNIVLPTNPPHVPPMDGSVQPSEGPEANDTDDGLEELTVAQLRDKANKDRIDLSGARTKDEIISLMRGEDDND